MTLGGKSFAEAPLLAPIKYGVYDELENALNIVQRLMQHITAHQRIYLLLPAPPLSLLLIPISLLSPVHEEDVLVRFLWPYSAKAKKVDLLTDMNNWTTPLPLTKVPLTSSPSHPSLSLHYFILPLSDSFLRLL